MPHYDRCNFHKQPYNPQKPFVKKLIFNKVYYQTLSKLFWKDFPKYIPETLLNSTVFCDKKNSVILLKVLLVENTLDNNLHNVNNEEGYKAVRTINQIHLLDLASKKVDL